MPKTSNQTAPMPEFPSKVSHPDWEAFFDGPFTRFDGTADFPDGTQSSDLAPEVEKARENDFEACRKGGPQIRFSPSGRMWKLRMPSVRESLRAFVEQSGDPKERRALALVEKLDLLNQDRTGEEDNAPWDGSMEADETALGNLSRQGSLVGTLMNVTHNMYGNAIWPMRELEERRPDLVSRGSRYACALALLSRRFEPYAVQLCTCHGNLPNGMAPWVPGDDPDDALKDCALRHGSTGALLFLAHLLLTDGADLDFAEITKLTDALAALATEGLWPALQAWARLAARLGTLAVPNADRAALFRELLTDACAAALPDAFATAGDPALFFLTRQNGAACRDLVLRGLALGSVRACLEAVRFIRPGWLRNDSVVPDAVDLATAVFAAAHFFRDRAALEFESSLEALKLLFSGPWDVRNERELANMERVHNVNPIAAVKIGATLREHALRLLFSAISASSWDALFACARVLMRERLLDRPDARRYLEDGARAEDPIALFHSRLLVVERYFRKHPPRTAKDDREYAEAMEGLRALAEKDCVPARVLLARARRYGLLGVPPAPAAQCLALVRPLESRPASVHARATLLCLTLDAFLDHGEERLFAAADKAVADLFNLMRADHLVLARVLILADHFERAGGEAALGERYPDLTAAMKGVLARHPALLYNFFVNSMPLQEDPVPLVALGQHLLEVAGDPHCEERIRAFLASAELMCVPDLSAVTDCASLGRTLLSLAARRGYVPTDPDSPGR